MFGFVRSMRARLGLLGLSMALAASAASAGYPEKPVRLIVPFAPGGGTDLIARTLGAGMAQELGKPIIVDNKPGAGTIIGTEAAAKSPARRLHAGHRDLCARGQPESAAEASLRGRQGVRADHADRPRTERAGGSSR